MRRGLVQGKQADEKEMKECYLVAWTGDEGTNKGKNKRQGPTVSQTAGQEVLVGDTLPSCQRSGHHSASHQKTHVTRNASPPSPPTRASLSGPCASKSGVVAKTAAAITSPRQSERLSSPLGERRRLLPSKSVWLHHCWWRKKGSSGGGYLYRPSLRFPLPGAPTGSGIIGRTRRRRRLEPTRWSAKQL